MNKLYSYPCDCIQKENDKERQEIWVRNCQIIFRHLGMGEPKFPYSAIQLEGDWIDPFDALARGKKLVLTGSVGNGKSTLIRWLAWNFILGAKVVRGGYVPTIMHRLKDFDSNEDYFRLLEKSDVLVLDDLDKMLGSTYELERLLSLVDIFCCQKKTILVSMNTDMPSLRKMLLSSKFNVSSSWVDSLISRLGENSTILNFKGCDFRKKAEEATVN